MAVNLLGLGDSYAIARSRAEGFLSVSRCGAVLITVLVLGTVASNAQATVLLSNSASGLSSSASFTISGAAGSRQLKILLTNTDSVTGAGSAIVPSEVVSGLFFNLGTATFTPVSATLESGAAIIRTNCEHNCTDKTNVGEEFSYASGGVNWLDEDSQGFSSSGYLIANANKVNFDGSNYDNPKALDGINFGIVSDGWVAGSGNGGLDGVALIEGIVKFVLDIPDGLEETDLNNVYFTYGTSPN